MPPLLLRSWNLFHGNTVPPRRNHRLEEMVRLASVDDPDVVCLQEVPVWALERLDDWSGMTALGDVAARPRLGPLPSSAELGRAITQVNHGLLRSAFTGQANGLSAVARLAWANERRLCQAVRVSHPDGTLLVANLHATSYRPDERLADAELFRAAVFADALARPGDVCVLAGDFNVRAARSRTLAELVQPDWGFSRPGPEVDHILVRGAPAGAVERWPDERRRRDGHLLSDHAPVELRAG
jgi:endonuclease/exonuclease/phosphatase family metal-dependent hydrolase